MSVPPGRLAASPVETPRRAEERPTSDLWPGFFKRLHRPVPFEELLQEVTAYVASVTPVHSLAFVSLLPPNEGEAIAALWKGTLPRLSARTLTEAREKTVPWEVARRRARVRVFPVPRPAGDPVGLLLVPAETALRPGALRLRRTRGGRRRLRARRAKRGGLRRAGRLAFPRSPGGLGSRIRSRFSSARSLALSNLKASLSRVASARAPILLVGDVGSDKTLVAETLHALSPRRSRPLVRVSATAASAQALEEDLLGAPAAGDRRRRVGRLFEADGGTLLVEEVGDLPSPTQALLFRLLEAREVTAPGGRTVPVDVRVIGTTSRPLTRAVEDGAFRDDLYFRLSALTLRLPPLKDRKEDIPALLDSLAARHGGPTAEHFDVEAMNALLNYQYPGNVRELENEVRRLAAQIGPGAITLADLDQKFSGEHVELALKESDDLKEIVEKVERQVIERVMRKVRGNQSLGARLLNISRGSLIAKMKEYDIKDFRYLKRGD